MKFSVSFFLLVAFASVVKAQRQTITTTATTTVTSYSVTGISTSTACVIYSDATTACRRRRQYWIDRPILLGLNEPQEKSSGQFINPQPVQLFEPTLVPNVHPQPYNIPYSDFARSSPEKYFHHGTGFSSAELQPSLMDHPGYRTNFSPYGYLPMNDFARKNPVKDAQVYAIIGQLLNIPVIVTSTATATSTVTITATVTTTTNTVTVSGCRPPAITYNTC